jgi:acetyltransferase-like isoleucine patch superfamily enzyme
MKRIIRDVIWKVVFRIWRTIIFKRNIYGKIGKKNHFSKGVILYEKSIVGNYNYFSPYSLINNSVIGNYCQIGPGCKIGLASHDITAISTNPKIYNGQSKMDLFDDDNPTILENDIWLGSNVVVKQGVKIGHGAVVGANSVVTHDIEPYTVSYGAPAKKIKYRFSDELINKIINSEWYSYNLTEARKLVSELFCEKENKDFVENEEG